MKFLMEQIALRLFSSVVQYTSISFPSCSIWFRLTVDLYDCLPQHHEGWAAGWHCSIFHLNPASWSWTSKCFEEHLKMHTHPQITDAQIHGMIIWHQSLSCCIPLAWCSTRNTWWLGFCCFSRENTTGKGKSRRKWRACVRDTNKSKSKSSSS